jgi:hypothetical protein
MALITFSNTTPLYQATPADPAGTTNTTGVMLGLGATITPQFSGRLMIFINGNLTNSTAAAGNGAKVQVRYGTGSAPAAGAALTGAPVGSLQQSVLERATANDLQTFCLQVAVTGLAVGTPVWFDLSIAAVVAGTALAKSLNVSAMEI